MENERELALEKVKEWKPDVNIENVKFHCDDCLDTTECEFAWDLYNTYGDGIRDTGPLCFK